jgi:excinuclease ABC subunit C
VQKDELEQFQLPDSPGVYVFLKKIGSKTEALYVGKATSLKARVRSYFASDLLDTRGGKIVSMVEEANDIQVHQTDSVLEALILEANLIKKEQPHFNTKEKDNKSYNFLVITKETFPRVLVIRGRELYTQFQEDDILELFGPFPQGASLTIAMKMLRKIFPYRDKCELGSSRPCFNAQIGLCPGVCTGVVTKEQYAETIQDIQLLFRGEKRQLLQDLEQRMSALSNAHEYEKAHAVKKQVGALTHIHDIALIKDEFRSLPESSGNVYRIEAYDVAHLSGTNTVGVMTVVIDGLPDAKLYRTFNIKTSTNDDYASLRELLTRRLGHPEWGIPSLIVVDGGEGQLSIARAVLEKLSPTTQLVSVVKDDAHKARGILPGGIGKPLDTRYEPSVYLANAEAHRFALRTHRQKRARAMGTPTSFRRTKK